LVSAGIAQW
jgi:hypothetical protein